MNDAPGATRLVVPPEHSGLRLDQLLAAATALSRRRARVVIGEGRVSIDGRPVKVQSRPVELATVVDVRLPAGDGPHPFVLIAYGNGGGGIDWLRDRMHRFRHVTDVLVAAGYACAWTRYRTEVELGYQTGGRLRVEGRQGMELMNRAELAEVRERIGRDPASVAADPGLVAAHGPFLFGAAGVVPRLQVLRGQLRVDGGEDLAVAQQRDLGRRAPTRRPGPGRSSWRP